MKKRVSIVSFFVLNAFMISGFSQTLTIKLWPDGIPGSITNPSYVEKITTADGRITRCEKVVTPDLTVFLPALDKANGSAVFLLMGALRPELDCHHHPYF